jgi:hypothetical protein
LKPWEQRVADPLVAADVLPRIAGGDDLVRHFGCWPPFEDAELISLQFHRGNHMAVVPEHWGGREPPTLEATFYVFNAEAALDSIDRRPAHVSLVFSELHEVQIDGLNYQNPIQGLGIHLEPVERLKRSCFRVNWGGTGMKHEVSLLCDGIAVRCVTPLVVSPNARGLTSR